MVEIAKRRTQSNDKILCACGLCEELIDSYDKQGRERRFKNGHNMRCKPLNPGLIRPGPKHWNWKGGKRINTQGYVMIYAPDHPEADSTGCVREHRLVMEQVLGRRLEPLQVVHHINGNKQDNRCENLVLESSHSE